MISPFLSKKSYHRRHRTRTKVTLVTKEIFDRTAPEVRRSLNMKIVDDKLKGEG